MSNTEANKERVKLLVDALRSGDYTQTQHTLEINLLDGNKLNCCLGVACRVAIQNGLELKTTERATQTYFGDLENGSDTLLPLDVVAWYGFEDTDPDLTVDDGEVVLPAIILNDNRRYSFNEIADAFENTFLKGAKGN